MSGAFDEVIVVGEVVETEEYELSPPPSPPARPCSPNMPPLVLPGPTQIVRRRFSDRSALGRVEQGGGGGDSWC